jgi:hypothetical protein
VADAQQQHVAIEVMDAADRAVEPMRHVERVIGEHLRGFRAGRGKRMRVVAAEDARHPPEGVRIAPIAKKGTPNKNPMIRPFFVSAGLRKPAGWTESGGGVRRRDLKRSLMGRKFVDNRRERWLDSMGSKS